MQKKKTKKYEVKPSVHYITLLALLISNLSTLAIGISLSNMMGVSMGELVILNAERKLAQASLYYDDGSSSGSSSDVRGGGGGGGPKKKPPSEFPGGFIEKSFSSATRPRLTTAQIASFLPASRGKFTFPAPYNTTGIRITDPSDCTGSTDCVNYIGYSYWRNINNHVGSDTLYIFLGLSRSRGGAGPTLFSYNKVTDQISKAGALFASSDPLSYASGEGWYFSGTQPTKLYINSGSSLYRYDVLTHVKDTVLDISTQPALYGSGRYIWQMHSSDDDRVHIGTVRDNVTYAMLGCFVYQENTGQYSYYLSRGGLNECNLDASGRWLLMLDKTTPTTPELDNRIIDLQTGAEQVVLDQDGGLGHLDMGAGYAIGADNWNPLPGAVLLWPFPLTNLTRPVGSLIFYTADWSSPKVNHISHGNRKPGIAASQQFACGSNLDNITTRENEIYCFKLDGSFDTLVVAPVMSTVSGTGGGDTYSKSPKGNLDVSGQYFIWTSNLGGNRLDSFLVKIPSSF